MYKKAGIAIAIILVVAGILVLSISSCNKDGGIQVKPTSGTEESVDENASIGGTEEESINMKTENSSEDISDDYVSELSYIEESSVESVDSDTDISKNTEESSDNKTENSTDKTESSSSASLSEEEQSALAELQDYKDKKESSVESSEQSEKESEQSSEISTGDSTGRLEYKEINASDLPSKTQSKTVFGIITGKEMLVQGNNVFTTIIILDENSDSYRYFVPLSAYESLDKGTKLEVSIMVYFDEGRSIKQVTGVSVAE